MAVPVEDQALNFLTTIQNQAVQSGVQIITSTRQPERTNQFFLERAQGLTVQSTEAQLVDFLYKLGRWQFAHSRSRAFAPPRCAAPGFERQPDLDRQLPKETVGPHRSGGGPRPGPGGNGEDQQAAGARCARGVQTCNANQEEMTVKNILSALLLTAFGLGAFAQAPTPPGDNSTTNRDELLRRALEKKYAAQTNAAAPAADAAAP